MKAQLEASRKRNAELKKNRIVDRFEAGENGAAPLPSKDAMESISGSAEALEAEARILAKAKSEPKDQAGLSQGNRQGQMKEKAQGEVVEENAVAAGSESVAHTGTAADGAKNRGGGESSSPVTPSASSERLKIQEQEPKSPEGVFTFFRGQLGESADFDGEQQQEVAAEEEVKRGADDPMDPLSFASAAAASAAAKMAGLATATFATGTTFYTASADEGAAASDAPERELPTRDAAQARILKDQRKAAERERQAQADRIAWTELLTRWESQGGTAPPRPSMARTTREMIFRGIPSNMRPRAWPLLLGNDLKVTDELFEIFAGHGRRARMALEAVQKKTERKHAKRVQEMERKKAAAAAAGSDGGNDEGPGAEVNTTPRKRRASSLDPGSPLLMAAAQGVLGREESLALIDMDIPRTFPDLAFFTPGGGLDEELRKVLEAYVCYRPDVGYVQGMSFLGAFLLLNANDSTTASKCLCALLGRHVYMDFFRFDLVGMRAHLACYEELFQHRLPSLFRLFRKHSVEAELYMIDWMLTLFSKSMPLNVAGE